MAREKGDLQNDVLQRQRALSRWDNEGGAGVSGPQLDPALRGDRIPGEPTITETEMPASSDVKACGGVSKPIYSAES